MKLIKTMLTVGAALSLLALAGCSSATSHDATPEDPAAAPLTLLDFTGGVDQANWENTGGWQNSATDFPDLAIVDTGAQAYRANNYLFGGNGTTSWVDGTNGTTLYPATKELAFHLRVHFNDESGGDSQDSHVLMNFKNLDLSKLSKYTGLTFAIRVPKFSESDYVKNTGFTVLIRKRTADNENTAVYLANLGDGDAGQGLIGNVDGSKSDWAYWGNGNLVVVKVPFDFFTVPGWLGGPGNEPAGADTIAKALAAGTVFNSIDFDFRFNADGSSYSEDVDYPAYVSNVGLY